MDKASTSTPLHSLLLEEPVGFLFVQTFLNWVLIMLRRFSPRLRSFEGSSTTHDEHCTKIPPSEPRGCFDLSREDVKMVMGRMGMCSQEGEQFDKGMGFDDLADLFTDMEPCLEEVKEAFCVFDEDSDGFIDAVELQRVLSKLGYGEGLLSEACEGMVAAYDQNGDGRIDFKEFVKLMERSIC